MRPIFQKDRLGCAVACVAFVLGINYNEAKQLFAGPKDKARKAGFTCSEIVEAFRRFGCKYEYRYIKPQLRRKIYRSGTIVFIKRSKHYPNGHFLARAEDCWMDPWINFLVDKNLKKAQAGFRQKLPGRPIYALFKKQKKISPRR